MLDGFSPRNFQFHFFSHVRFTSNGAEPTICSTASAYLESARGIPNLNTVTPAYTRGVAYFFIGILLLFKTKLYLSFIVIYNFSMQIMQKWKAIKHKVFVTLIRV